MRGIDPLITVIVPVYNAEKFLDECIQSIINQTYKNLEIILIDDGSTDKSSNICKQFAKIDKRIKVICKANSGVSDSRNLGVQKALGEYITFVDSDDFINENMIFTLCNSLKKYEVEISICNYQIATPNLIMDRKINGKVEIYSGERMIENFLYQKVANSPWGILVPTELCRRTPFPIDCAYGEDLATVYKYFLNCQKVAYHFDKLYFYRKNPNGITHKNFNVKMFDEIEIVNEIVSFSQENMPSLLAAAMSRKYSTYAKLLRKIPQNTSDMNLLSTKHDLWTFLQKYRWQMMRDPKARIKNRIGAMCTIFGCKIFSFL